MFVVKVRYYCTDQTIKGDKRAKVLPFLHCYLRWYRDHSSAGEAGLSVEIEPLRLHVVVQ